MDIHYEKELRETRVSLLVALCLLLVGCIPSRSLTIDSNFTAKEVSYIVAAAEAWSAATDDPDSYFFTRVGVLPVLTPEQWQIPHTGIYRMDSSNPTYAWMIDEFASTGFNGAEQHGNMVLVMDHFGEDIPLLRGTIRHEFGHLLGLQHLDAPGLMSQPRTTNCIDQATLDAYCSDNDCGPDSAPEC